MTHHNKQMKIMIRVITIQGLSSMMMIMKTMDTTRTKAQMTIMSQQNFCEIKPVRLTSVGVHDSTVKHTCLQLTSTMQVSYST